MQISKRSKRILKTFPKCKTLIRKNADSTLFTNILALIFSNQQQLVLMTKPAGQNQKKPIFLSLHQQNFYYQLMQQTEVAGTYKPFKYPPDYALARIHQKATMPGQNDPLQLSCPCCNQQIKKPFTSWWNRSIEKDFKDYGGGIVSYFWLVKLYCVTIVIVIALYGIYLQYLTWNYCEELDDQLLKKEVCNKLFGVWIVTNEDLYEIIERVGDHDVIIRFGVLRSMIFLILITVNASSLYIMKWFKTRYPDKVNVSNFSLFFKNLASDKVEDLLTKLRNEFGHFQVKQAFVLKQAQPYYMHYKQKLELYYECKREEKQKKLEKLRKKLDKLQAECEKNESQFQTYSRRAIIVFNDINVRDKILNEYSFSRIRKNIIFFKGKYGQPDDIYCEECPRPEEILWQNIGIPQRVSNKVKFRSNLMYFGLLLVALFVLFLLSRILYFDQLVGPIRVVVQNFVLIIAIIIAFCFRKCVDMLADMRFPITFTQRTMFIIITTTLLHFIFFLWLPSMYLNFYHDNRGEVLNLMSNQALTAVIVQIILTYFDFFYCCWNKNKKKIEDEDKPYACQKILHQSMQYPRFPIEFKMIVLFKFWSLMTFFGFHIPMVLFLILVALSYHYIKDKYNLYFHYRSSQVIDNKVQFNFLKIYTNLFTIYMYIILVHTQKNFLEYIIGAAITAIALFFQIFYINSGKKIDPHEEQIRIKLLSSIEKTSLSFYREQHDNFFESVQSQAIDMEIKNYLGDQKKNSERLSEQWSINGRN